MKKLLILIVLCFAPFVFADIKSSIKDLSAGVVDFAILPIDVALYLHSKSGGKVVCVAVVQEADFYIVSTFARTLSELVSHELLVGESSGEKILSWVLTNMDMTVGQRDNDVHISKRLPFRALNDTLSGEAAILATSGELKLLKSMADKALYSIDLQDAFLNITGDLYPLPQKVLVTLSDYAQSEEHLKLLATTAQKEVKERNNKAPLANHTFRPAKDAKKDILHFLKVHNEKAAWYEKLPEPGENFFAY